VDSFVNFLSAPEKDERANGVNGGGGVKFEEDPALADGRHGGWEVPKEAEGNVVMDAYPVSYSPHEMLCFDVERAADFLTGCN
jgi:hypothetical protein